MNRGPMSRLVKVPVKCKNCGKIKYNVVCKDAACEEKKEAKQETQKPAEEKKNDNKPKKQIAYKKPKEYNYLKTVVKKQNNIAAKAYSRDK